MSTVAVAAAIGVASHLLWFSRGEHHMLTPRYVQLFFAATLGTPIALVQLTSFSTLQAIGAVALITASYLTGLFTSLIIYRVYFAPTAKFPGPWQAGISTLWFMSTTGYDECYLRLERLHKQYGKFVRIGSNDLSITDPHVVDLAFGNHAVATKADWYDGSKPFDSMHVSISRDGCALKGSC
jgi:hypothetical protein